MFECNANTNNFIGYKIKLYPTEEQKIVLNKHFGFYRWTYNWSIDKILELRKEHKNAKYLTISKILGDMRNSIGYEWLKESPLANCRISIRSALKAFELFYSKRNNHPKYKSKKFSDMKFGVRGSRVYINSNGYLSFEGLMGTGPILYKKSSLPNDIKFPVTNLYNVWISYDKDNYWISFQMEYERYYDMSFTNQTDAIGIDVGLRKLATLSDGTVYISPNYRKLEKRESRLSRKMSKRYKAMNDIAKETRTKFDQIPKSKNLLKLESQFRKTLRKISNKQNTFLHTITKEIVNRNPKAIVVEDVSPQQMVDAAPNGSKYKKWISKKVYTQSLSKFFHYLNYKAKERSIQLIVADKEFPSSQLCCICGYRQHIGRSKVYTCPVCGNRIDRDLNAAINLKKLAY